MRPSFCCCLIAVVVAMALTGCQSVVDPEPSQQNPYGNAFAGAEVAPSVEQVLDLFERTGDPFDLSQPVIDAGDGLLVHVAHSEVSATMLLQIWRDDKLEAAQVIRVATRDGKLPLCHLPPGNGSKGRTMYVPREAWPAHLGHGDQLGPCEGVGAGVQAVSVDPISGIAARGTWRGGDDFVPEEVGISGGTDSVAALFTITPLDSVPLDLSGYPPLPPIPPAPTEYPFAVNLPEIPPVYEDLAGSGSANGTIGTQAHCNYHKLTCPDGHHDDGSDSGNDDPDGETGDGETGDGEDQGGDEDGTGDGGTGGSEAEECDEEERQRRLSAKETAGEEVETLEKSLDEWVRKRDFHEGELPDDREAHDEINLFRTGWDASVMVGFSVGSALVTASECQPTKAVRRGLFGGVLDCRRSGIMTLGAVDQAKRRVGDYFDERHRRKALENLIEYRETMIEVARTGVATVTTALEEARTRFDEAERAYDDYVWECATS